MRVFLGWPVGKGGPGSGEKEGHDYRGNQWDGGIPGRAGRRKDEPKRKSKFPTKTYREPEEKHVLVHRHDDSEMHELVKEHKWAEAEKLWAKRKPKDRPADEHKEQFHSLSQSYREFVKETKAEIGDKPTEFVLMDGAKWIDKDGGKPVKSVPGVIPEDRTAGIDKWVAGATLLDEMFEWAYNNETLEGMPATTEDGVGLEKLNADMWGQAVELDAMSVFRGVSPDNFDEQGFHVPSVDERFEMPYFMSTSTRPRASLAFTDATALTGSLSDEMAAKGYEVAFLDKSMTTDDRGVLTRPVVSGTRVGGPIYKLNIPAGALGVPIDSYEDEIALAPGEWVYTDVQRDVVLRATGWAGGKDEEPILMYMPYYAEVDYVPLDEPHWSKPEIEKALTHLRWLR